ncbi:MAG: tetratricopeptide repeat protein [Myxococcaceae bacterium]|nr:tetratricopeptide repeat protein [Myxococcaceae bacterium]
MATSTRAPVNEEEFLGALYKGGELLAAGKIVEARSHLEKAHFLSPKNEKAQNLLGLTYFKLGLFDQASDIYEKLVNENPADPTLRVNLGLVYLKTNNLPRCIKEFETATDLDPDHKKAHNYLGLALAQAGDYAKAREHFILAGSEQMAEKMGRALSAKVESAPSSHGLVVPPPPPATATAVTAQPARPAPHASPPRPPPVARQTIAVAVAPPLPPPADDEIEVMSDDADVLDADAETAAVETSAEAPPPPPEPAFEPPQELPPVDASPFEPPEEAPADAVTFEDVPVETMPVESAVEAVAV